MRCGLLAWDFPPHPSGLSTAAFEIAAALEEAGADIRVFTLDRRGHEHRNGIEIIGCAIEPGSSLGWTRRRGALGHLAAPLAFRRAVLTAHRERPFDILEATNWYAPGALLAAGPVPLVTRHSTPAAFSREAGPRTLRDRLDTGFADRLERWSARRSAGHISNTQDHGARMAKAYGLPAAHPRAVIGLSLPPETLARGRGAAYPAASPAEGGEIRLLFVGRAEARKGFDALLDAAALLAAEQASLPPFAIRLVGVEDGEVPPALRSHVRALGRVGASELAAEYERAHAVLAPSRYESFGLVYQEAMAYGRPLVACAEDASARRFVGARGAGLLAPAASGPAVADAIRRILLDPALRLVLRDRALAAAGAFSRGTLGRETLALYEAVLRQGR